MPLYHLPLVRNFTNEILTRPETVDNTGLVSGSSPTTGTNKLTTVRLFSRWFLLFLSISSVFSGYHSLSTATEPPLTVVRTLVFIRYRFTNVLLTTVAEGECL